MGDVKLSPRQTARLLTYLDDSVRQMLQIKAQLIEAMAQRRERRAAKAAATPATAKKRER